MTLPENFLNRMARAGALAPSGDNLQPWSFKSKGDALFLRHEPMRDRSLFNVQYLASFIGLGAVLENIHIAASAENYRSVIEAQPDSLDHDWIARITFEPGAPPDPLAAFLEQRCTNRRFYSNRSVDPALLEHLNMSPTFPSTGLFWLREKDKLDALGKLIAQADRLIFENQHIHDHLFSTLRWTSEETERSRDGLPVPALELGRFGSLAFRGLRNWKIVNLINHFGFSKAASRHSIQLMRRCSAAGLITAADVSLLSFLHAGRAFQRLWLQATKENLAIQPMTAIIFLQLRARLAAYDHLTSSQIETANDLRKAMERFFLLKGQIPAMLFRVGFTRAPSARTIRREPMLHTP